MNIAEQWVKEDSIKYVGLTIEEKARKVVYEMGETGQIMKVAWMMEIEKALNAQIQDCVKAVENRLQELWKQGFGQRGSFSAVLIDIRMLAAPKEEGKEIER